MTPLTTVEILFMAIFWTRPLALLWSPYPRSLFLHTLPPTWTATPPHPRPHPHPPPHLRLSSSFLLFILCPPVTHSPRVCEHLLARFTPLRRWGKAKGLSCIIQICHSFCRGHNYYSSKLYFEVPFQLPMCATKISFLRTCQCWTNFNFWLW